jgi:dUTP pyrophosphatase
MFKDFYLKVELLSEDAKMPIRAHPGDAGLDFYTPKEISIFPRSDILIPLDLRIEMPRGYALIIQEKSGVSTKKKTNLGAKVIDADYRGNCHVHLFNHSDSIIHFNKGDKVAQGVVFPIWDGQPIQVESISANTLRGSGGFGSTGE